MALRKTYQSIQYIQLDTYVVVNGQKVLVQFRGGSLQPRTFGKFNTDNQELIAAMDMDSGNGKSFKCIHSEEIESPVIEDPKPLVIKEAPAPKPEVTEVPEEKQAEVKPFTSVPGITTVQAAKQYMADTFGIALSKMPNGAAVKKQAEANKVKFPDLP
jgi:hypothetical protein